MSLLEAIRTRRTVRTYDPRPVPPEHVEDILAECVNAPSACNRRGWRFVLVQDRDDLDWLYRQGGSSVLRNAGQALLVAYRADSDNLEWRDIEQSAAAAIMLFQLVAHSRGLGSCWICQLPPRREVARRFAVPRTHVPIGMITFGYYPESLNAKPRLPLAEPLLEMGRFAQEQQGGRSRFASGAAGGAAAEAPVAPAPLHAGSCLPGARTRLAVRRILRSVFFRLPGRSLLRPLVDRFEKKFDNEVREDREGSDRSGGNER